jgi:hypothetical protein
MWVLKTRERHLRAFPGRRVERHSTDESLERFEMIGERGGSETVIQRVLTERALRPIESGKDLVEIEISPRPLIERTPAGENSDSGSVRCGHGVHTTDAFDRRPPCGANSSEALSAAATDRCDDE